MPNTMRVANTAGATLVLGNVRTIATLANTNPALNAVIGFVDNFTRPDCRTTVGSRSPLQVLLQQARGSSLRVTAWAPPS